MCQPFSCKAVVPTPRSLSGVVGDRGAGAVLPAPCSCAGRLGIPGDPVPCAPGPWAACALRYVQGNSGQPFLAWLFFGN